MLEVGVDGQVDRLALHVGLGRQVAYHLAARGDLDPARARLAAQHRLEIFLERLLADLETGRDVERVLRLPIFFGIRSEEHTSELQSLMRISYDVFCLKKKK